MMQGSVGLESEWQRAQLLSNDPFLQEPVSGLQQTTIRSEGGDNLLRFLASACFYISCLLPSTLPRPLQGFHLLTAFQSPCEGDTTWCQVQVVRMMILFREQGKQCIVSAVFLISLNDILLLNNGKLLLPDRIMFYLWTLKGYCISGFFFFLPLS